MSGRQRESINALLEKGNKSHLTKAEIEERKIQEEKLKVLPSDKIRPPTWLDKEAKKVFKDIVINLESVEILANVDTYNIAILADAMSKYIRATKQLEVDIQISGKKKDGLLIAYTNKAGATNWIENPLIKVQIKYSEMIKKYSSVIGLNPASRLKIIQVNSGIDDDEFDRDFN